MFEQLQQRPEGPATFAEPDGPGVPYGAILKRAADSGALSLPGVIAGAALDIAQQPGVYADIFTAAERKQRLVDNAFAQTRATEEAYDRHIGIVKEASGVELENPLRGGYAREARAAIRDEMRANGGHSVEGTGGIPEYQQRIYNQRLAELQQKHPDLAGLDLAAQARQIAREAEGEPGPGGGLSDFSPAAFAAQFAGAIWAGRRDPLYVGSMFAGPTGAVGATTLARIASAGLFQGLYNAGLSALEQPAVQAWRGEAGLKSGIEPAVENVGLAFLFGLIPGAAFRGLHEELARTATAARPAIERVLNGRASADEVAAAVKFADELRRSLGLVADEREAGALKVGADMQAADHALTPERAPEVSPDLHHNLTAAALKRADDLDAPSPEAVLAVKYIDAYHGSPHEFDAFSLVRPEPDPELRARIAEAKPQSEQEAQLAADAALDDFGRREGLAVLKAQSAENGSARTEQAAAFQQAAEAPARDDPLGKVPFAREDGSPTTVTPQAVAKMGERETEIGMLIRSCN